MQLKIVNDSKLINKQFNNTIVHKTGVIYEIEQQKSVGTTAADELYTLLRTFCLMVETFYKPLLPEKVEFYDVMSLLHEDTFRLCQSVVFRESYVTISLLILMRADSQLDDKDIRHKCRIMAKFTTEDFGLDEQLQLICKKVNHLCKSSLPEILDST